MPKSIFNYIFISLILFIFIGCSSSDESSISPELQSEFIANSSENPVEKIVSYLMIFNPQKDGFGFKNFRGGEDSSSIKIQDLIEFFGIITSSFAPITALVALKNIIGSGGTSIPVSSA